MNEVKFHPIVLVKNARNTESLDRYYVGDGSPLPIEKYMRIEISDGVDTATAVIASSQLADSMRRGEIPDNCSLKLTLYYTCGEPNGTKVIILLKAEVVRTDDEAAAFTTLALMFDKSIHLTFACTATPSPFVCNFTGAGLLTAAVPASLSLSAPSAPMAGGTSAALSSITPSTHRSTPWNHASAEQLATRRILTIKQRSTPMPAVPAAAATAAETTTAAATTPDSLANLFAGWQGLRGGERGGGEEGEGEGEEREEREGEGGEGEGREGREGGGEGGEGGGGVLTTAVPLPTPYTNPSLAASITPSASMTSAAVSVSAAATAVSAATATAATAAAAAIASHPATRNGTLLTKPPTSPLENLLSLRAAKANIMEQTLYGAKMVSLRERVMVLEASRLCVVCLENPKNVVIAPCNHLCVCQSCSKLIKWKCPICRGNVVKKTVVYV